MPANGIMISPALARKKAGGTPLLDAALDVIEQYTTAELWKLFDKSTTFQTDNTSTPVTIQNGTQVIGLAQGQRRTGTNIDFIQPTAS